MLASAPHGGRAPREQRGGPLDGRDDVPLILATLRAGVVAVMRQALWLGPVLVAVLWFARPGDVRGPLMLALIVVLLTLPVAGSALARDSVRTQALVQLCGCCVALSLAVATVGPLMGGGTLLALCCALGSLFFGIRGGLAIAGWGVLSLGVAGFAAVRGHLTLVGGMEHVLTGGDWARLATTSGALGATIASLVAYCIRALGAAALAERAARQRETAALEERAVAERAFAEAQRGQALARLASGIAHDVNNALTVIMANAELAVEEPSPAERQEMLEAVLGAARAARQTTHSLSAWSRPAENGSGAFRPWETLERLARSLPPVLPPQVRLEVRCACGEDAWCAADAGLFEQAVVNLVLNGRDAMPDGGTLLLTCREVERAAARFVSIEVRDTGVGMAPETLRRVFEPFFTTKPPGRGTGLGLAMVKAFVEGAGGDVSVESTPGKGTTVRLELARVTPSAADSAEAEAEPARGAEAGLRVLLLEDQTDVRRGMARALRRHGYEVVEAPTVAAARAVVGGEARVDVLCTNVMLSDGGALQGLLVEYRARHDGGVVLCAGHREGSSESPLLRTAPPGTPILWKPFTLDELLRQVRRARAPLDAGAEPAASSAPSPPAA